MLHVLPDATVHLIMTFGDNRTSVYFLALCTISVASTAFLGYKQGTRITRNPDLVINPESSVQRARARRTPAVILE